jgi:tetratricopeptide (TPR) repeat protein
MTMDKKTLIKTAYLHFRDGQLDQAREQYFKLLELDSTDVLALNMLGDIYAHQGHVTEALQYYKQAVQLLILQNIKDKAEMIKRKMSKLDPNSVEEEFSESEPKAAAVASEPAGIKDAIETLKTRIAADPKNLELYQKLAETLAKAGRNHEAAEQFLVIANALYNNRLFKKAEPIFQQIVQLDPANLQAHIALGEIFSKDGSDSEAKKEFLYVAEHLIRQGNLERGQLFAQKAIQLKSIEAHYYLGMVYYQKNQTNEARTEFETLLKFKLNHQGALTHLAQILTQSEQWDEAWAVYERLVKADAKNGDAWENMAQLALKQGKNDTALEKFTQAMEIFAADEQWERAALCASQAVKIAPRNPELYLKLADASYNAGLEQQAAEACMALAEMYDTLGRADEANQMRAKSRELLGEGSPAAPASTPVQAPSPAREETASTPAAVKSISPADEIKVMLNIASTYIRQGSFDEAIEIYQQIAKKAPDNEEVKTALTRAYAMFAGVNPETAVAKKSSPAAKPAGKVNEDEQRLQREARERAQKEAQLRAQRSMVTPPESAQATAPKPVAAVNDFMQNMGPKEDEIAGDHQDEFMTVTVAEIYTKQGLLNEALKIYQKILEIEPGNMEAQMKKQELESTMAEQERLRKQSEEAARKKIEEEKAAEAARLAAEAKAVEDARLAEEARIAEAARLAAEAKAAEAARLAAEAKAAEQAADKSRDDKVPDADLKSEEPKSKDDNQEPPSGRGRRGRVSYV